MIQFIFGIVGGTALLMYGVDMMGEGLERMSGNMMKRILERFTGKLWKAFLAGIFLTAVVQSSTAISVLSVGFVNSGIMKLSQAIGIIYGANIGTTVTAQFMAFSFSFNLIQLSLPIVAAGFIMKIIGKGSKIINAGHSVMGVGFLLLGLKILNEGIPYMQQNESIQYFFSHYASNVILGILIGTITTALVHSSSATVGIVILLGNAGLISLTTAVILMLGDNIGTSVTALIASINGNINAKRTAWGHALHNVIGVVIALPFLHLFVRFIEYFTLTVQGSTNIQLQIANSHTIFNIVVALIFLPLNDYFVKLLLTIIKEKKSKEKVQVSYLDKLLLDTPVAALGASLRELRRTTSYSRTMAANTFSSILENNLDALKEVGSMEKNVVLLQKDLTNYMIALSKRNLSETQSIMLPGIIKGAKYLERMANHTNHLMDLQKERYENEMFFTQDALDEMKEISALLDEMYEKTCSNLSSYREADFTAMEELHASTDLKLESYSINHVHRLENEECSLDASLVYLEMLSTLESISDYLYKIEKLCRYELRGIAAPVE
ncbi:Na/Pi cotransporter family protein [Proteiniclasticum sp. C24MP]|uniref:Na/Pi cotransporter family protein n=1 Tax=Proteiniclasticum sp. C24MP TaxID=3374101 RepID=UPI003754141F